MKNVFLLFVILCSISCNIEPKPIEYGQDQCSACKMIISDQRFGAELVTTKGKVYKYDAIECLVPEVIKNGTEHYSHILVTDFYTPGILIDVKESSFLISTAVPSPMGGNLSAYSAPHFAISNKGESLGDIYDWDELLKNLVNLKRYSYQ